MNLLQWVLLGMGISFLGLTFSAIFLQQYQRVLTWQLFAVFCFMGMLLFTEEDAVASADNEGVVREYREVNPKDQHIEFKKIQEVGQWYLIREQNGKELDRVELSQ